MSAFSYVLLDLGGVLYGVDYSKTLKALGLPPDNLAFFAKHPLITAYERGLVSTVDFVAELCKALQISPDQAIAGWNAMLLGPLPEGERLLRALHPHYPLALLSNTNDLHLEIVAPQITPWKDLFVKQFFSNQLGRRKPDPETYLAVLEALGWPPSQTLFIDDSAQNIEGARKAGLQTLLASANKPLALLPQLHALQTQ